MSLDLAKYSPLQRFWKSGLRIWLKIKNQLPERENIHWTERVRVLERSLSLFRFFFFGHRLPSRDSWHETYFFKFENPLHSRPFSNAGDNEMRRCCVNDDAWIVKFTMSLCIFQPSPSTMHGEKRWKEKESRQRQTIVRNYVLVMRFFMKVCSRATREWFENFISILSRKRMKWQQLQPQKVIGSIISLHLQAQGWRHNRKTLARKHVQKYPCAVVCVVLVLFFRWRVYCVLSHCPVHTISRRDKRTHPFLVGIIIFFSFTQLP